MFSISKKVKIKIKLIVSLAVSIECLKTLKYHTFSKKHYFFLLFAVSVAIKVKIYFKKKNKIKY